MTFNFSNNKDLSQLSGMPQMNTTLNGWQVPLTIQKVIQGIVEGDKSETYITYTFKGVWQPLRAEELQSIPDMGIRSWEWIWIHAEAGSLNLETGDKVIFLNKRYKIMQVKDYSLNSFVEYMLVRDYEESLIYE